MQIKTSVKINVEKVGKNLIVKELGTLTLITGSAGVAGNCSLYNIKREKGYWVVPVQTVKDRIKFIQARIDKQERYLEIMKQVVR